MRSGLSLEAALKLAVAPRRGGLGTFTPREDYYEFHGTGTIQPLISGLVQNHNHNSAVACYAARQTSNDELILGKVRQS